MGSVAITRYFSEDAFASIWSLYPVSHRIRYFFRPSAGVCQIIFSFVLMNPRCFREIHILSGILDIHHTNRTVYFNHILLQLGIIANLVAPEYPGLPVIVNKHGRVYAHPPMCGPRTILVGEQWFAERILEGATRIVRHRHTYSRTVRTGIEIVFSIAFRHV